MGSWFDDNIHREVGDGSIFLTDRLLGDVPLCDRFSRLHVLGKNTLCMVAKMQHLGWDEGEAWKWIRRLNISKDFTTK